MGAMITIRSRMMANRQVLYASQVWSVLSQAHLLPFSRSYGSG